MPSKRNSKKSTKMEIKKNTKNTKNKKNVTVSTSSDDENIKSNKNKIYHSDDDVEEFQNSEDEYQSQSGGETEDSENELGTDSATIDVDPDDEEDPNEDDKYDPVNESEELEDPDDENVEEIIEEEGEENEEGEGEGEREGAAEENEEYVGEAKACHLKNLNKDFIVLDEDDSNLYSKMNYKKIADKDRESDPIMTYYEMVRIIGTRAQQFNFGAEPLVKGLEGLHPAKMAYLELVAKMTPFIIRRHFPAKRYEEWRVDELEIIHVITDDFFVPEKFDWNALMKQASELNRKNIIETTDHSRIKPKKTTSKTKKNK